MLWMFIELYLLAMWFLAHLFYLCGCLRFLINIYQTNIQVNQYEPTREQFMSFDLEETLDEAQEFNDICSYFERLRRRGRHPQALLPEPDLSLYDEMRRSQPQGLQPDNQRMVLANCVDNYPAQESCGLRNPNSGLIAAGTARPSIPGTERRPNGEISCNRCIRNPKDVKFIPCGYSLCFSCYNRVHNENQNCPRCIIPFRRHSWVYW